MTDLHANYDKLTEEERDALDDAMHILMSGMRARGFPLAGDDRAERATDALAVCIIAARS